MSQSAENDAQVHRDALADTHEAYTAYEGWVLTCLWCDFTARGKTKRAALAHMQDHYDRLLGEGCDLR